MGSGHEPKALTHDQLAGFAADYEREPKHRAVGNAVAEVAADKVALNRRVIFETDFTFSVHLDDWKVTNQKASGRCWMFAGLNLLRASAMKRMNTKEFEFSQNHILFWDKLERANFFLEAMIQTAERDVDVREVAFLLSCPLADGGQWHMFANIVGKHGLAPKAFMPETESSSSTRCMNSILLLKLREGTKELRALGRKGAPAAEVQAAKNEILSVVYRILRIHLGAPPSRFVWQWQDKDRGFHRDAETSPMEFGDAYMERSLDEYACLVNDPRSTHPYGRTYTVRYLGNVVGGDPVIYLNTDISTMKRLAAETLAIGEPVWFGCDMSKMTSRDLGIMDPELYDYEALYDTTFEKDKEAALLYHHSQMTHAMLFTGVDVVDDRPRRWRVENSWGEEPGSKGFFVMNDGWFDRYIYEVAVRKELLPDDLRKALEMPPTELPPWDPMGALAGGRLQPP